VSIKDCTLRVPNESTTLFLLRVIIKAIFIHWTTKVRQAFCITILKIHLCLYFEPCGRFAPVILGLLDCQKIYVVQVYETRPKKRLKGVIDNAHLWKKFWIFYRKCSILVHNVCACSLAYSSKSQAYIVPPQNEATINAGMCESKPESSKWYL